MDGLPDAPAPATAPPPDPVELARALHSLAQEGLTYTRDPFDRRRYERLRAHAADLLAAHVDGDAVARAAVRAAVLAEEGYLTPKIDVRAAVRAPDGSVLLVQETADGGWTMPGGWADVDESLAEGAVREVAEEAGVAARAQGLLGLYVRDRRGHRPPMPWFCLKAVVACVPVDGKVTSPRPDAMETSAAAWFTPGQARGLPLSPGRTSPWLLERTLALLEQPLGPADLD